MLPGLASLVASAAVAASGASTPPGSPLSLDDAIARALAANLDLAAARLALPVAGERVAAARQRPNPDLDLEETRETPRDAVTLTFPVETAGKRGRRIEVAETGVAAGEAELARTTMAVRSEVRRAFYALCAAQRRVEVARALVDLSRRARDAARERFEAGAAPRLEVLQAELVADQADNEVTGTEASLAATRERLNVVLALPAGAPTAVGGDLGDGTVPDAADALEAALRGSADLAALDARIAEQSARVSLARAERSPDVALSGAATHRAPGEFDWGWRAALGLTLPVFQSGRAEVRLEEAALAQVRAERAAAEARLRSDVAAAAALAAALRTAYLRYKDEILPRAADVEAMAEESYRAGETSLVAMIQAMTSVRDLRGKAVDAGLAYQDALADLERAVGAPLP